MSRPTQRIQRSARIAALGSRLVSRSVAARGRAVFDAAGERKGRREAAQLKNAEDVVRTLGGMRGAVMKLGQMASYVAPTLPESVRNSLARLQQRSPGMTAELAEHVVATEFGQPLRELFSEWDPEPLAAASIGQVHRAITRDGRALAVKVQYPGVENAMRSDLANLNLLMLAIAQAVPGLDPRPIAVELAARFAEELDYEHEATNQGIFFEHFSGHPFIQIPAVHPDLCTRRVLATDLVVGSSYDDVASWSDAERGAAGETLYRFVTNSTFRLRSFNGDPHPGNYVFHRDGVVTFLDFGLVRHFEHTELDLYARLIETMVVRPDPEAFRRALETAGLLRARKQVTTEQVWDYFAPFYEFFALNREFTVDDEYASAIAARMFGTDAESRAVLRYLHVPTSFVVIQRINLGLIAVLGGLRARRNWRAVAEEDWHFTLAPPSTPMGVQLAKRWPGGMR